MDQTLIQSHVIGAGRVAVWADLLDSINVFPVPDGDTGRNMKVSLAPLRTLQEGADRTVRRLMMNARGNSGNIAAQFFSGFLTAASQDDLPQAARIGRDRAWQAVYNPKPGTMLTVLDALSDALSKKPKEYREILSVLENAVRSTPKLLPVLKDAGVVDAGALGLYIYFEGFFKTLAGDTSESRPVTEIFGEQCSLSQSFTAAGEEGYCVDLTIEADEQSEEMKRALSAMGESVVVIPGDRFIKVHLHTNDAEEVRRRLQSLGSIVRWADDNLEKQIREFAYTDKLRPAIHVMTDAAGSLTRDDARNLGMTLLDSYVSVGDLSAPETCVDAAEVYAAMRRGVRATTSQASDYERTEILRAVTGRYGRVLYLCVGSAFSGIYDFASRWKSKYDSENLLTVIDTGAASGRLGAAAIAVGRRSIAASSADEVISFARQAIERCREYIFIDNLSFLAAGGRISRTKAFFGNMLNMKPVVTPTAEGVVKAGVAKNLDDQIAFARARLSEETLAGSSPLVLVQYTDNRDLVEKTIAPALADIRPEAEIIIQPLSLTTGVHVGPGTWSLAFLPEG